MTVHNVGKSMLQLSLEKALEIAQEGDTLLISEGAYRVTGSHAKSLNVQAAQPENPPTIHGQWNITGGQWRFSNLYLVTEKEATVKLEGGQAVFKNCRINSAESNAIFAEPDQKNTAQASIVFKCLNVTFGDNDGSTPTVFTRGKVEAEIRDCQFLTSKTNAINSKKGSSIDVQNCQFSPSTYPQLVANGGKLDISDCRFQNTYGQVVKSSHQGVARLTDCQYDNFNEAEYSINYAEESSKIEFVRCHFNAIKRCVINFSSSIVILDSCEFNSCTVRTALYGNNSTISIKKSIFIDIEENSIYCSNSQVNITGCIFEDKPQGFPSLFLKECQLEMVESNFLNHLTNAINLREGSSAEIKKCEFHSNGNYVLIFAKNAKMDITDCIFMGDSAVVSSNEATQAIIKDCHFANINKNSPINAYDSQVLAQNCTFGEVSNRYLLYAEGETAKIVLKDSELTGRKHVARANKKAHIDLTQSTVDSSAIDEKEGGVVLYKGRPQVATTGSTAPKAAAAPLQTGKAKPDPELLEEGLNTLNALIGLGEVKAEVKKLVALVKLQQRREAQGLPSAPVTLHLVFTGNPGTGKTTVARIIGKIYRGLGLLSSDKVIETDRSGLVGEYIGHTAGKTQEKINEALDGILFIDEAYALVVKESSNDFGREAIDTLLKQMEDNRHRLAVIVAGYTGKMQEFIASNPGLASRFTRIIPFADYAPPELLEIFEKMCADSAYQLSEQAQQTLSAALEQVYANRDQNFGNGRDVRTVFENAVEQHALRASEDLEADLSLIEQVDIEGALQEWRRA